MSTTKNDGVERHASLVEQIERLQPDEPRTYERWTATLPQVCRLFEAIRGSKFTTNSLRELAVELARDIIYIKDEALTTKVWGNSKLTLQEGTLLYTTNSGRNLKLYEIEGGRINVTFDAEENPSRFFYATCRYFFENAG